MAEQHAEKLQTLEDASEAPARHEALDTVVAAIALDARLDPEGYARDTRVPEGGE